MEKEALFLESLAIALAAHNSQGLVLVQVERLAATGSLHPRQVKIPGILVDSVVVSRPDPCPQCFFADPCYDCYDDCHDCDFHELFGIVYHNHKLEDKHDNCH